jgi:hypothetical protein
MQTALLTSQQYRILRDSLLTVPTRVGSMLKTQPIHKMRICQSENAHGISYPPLFSILNARPAALASCASLLNETTKTEINKERDHSPRIGIARSLVAFVCPAGRPAKSCVVNTLEAVLVVHRTICAPSFLSAQRTAARGST